MLLPGIHVSVSCQVNNLFEITCRTGTYDHFWLFYIIHADLFFVFLLSKVFFFLGGGNTLDCWRRRKLYALLCKDMLPWANINNFGSYSNFSSNWWWSFGGGNDTGKNILMCSLLAYLLISNQNSHLENIFEIKSLTKIHSWMQATSYSLCCYLKAFLILLL